MIKQHIGVQTSTAVLLASLLAVAVRLDAPAVVRVPLGLLVAFVLPGWLGFRAVRGRPPRTLIDAAMCLIGSVGFLIALGIFLDLFDPGLTPQSWSVGMLATSVVLAFVVMFRSAETSHEAANPKSDISTTYASSRGRQQIRTAGQVVVAAALLGVAAITTLSSQRAQVAEQRFTELWLSGDMETQLVHVVNHEGHPMDYRVAVAVQGQRRSIMELHLADGKEWTTNVKLPQRRRERPGTPVVAVSLYRGGEDTAYRKVHVNWAGS